MTQTLARLHRTLQELRRRHVYRVAGGYVVMAWVILQVADVVLPAFLVPDWVMSLLVLLGIAGLPLVVVLTWIYDLTPDGIRRTPARGETGTAEDEFHWNWRWIDYLIILVLATILTVVLLQDEQHGTPLAEDVRSIAVMPFSDLSPQGDQRFFSDGLSEALMDGLSEIPELDVAARTSAFSFRNTELGAVDVAEALNVDALLEGSVRKADNVLRISVRLIDGKSGRQLWNRTFTAHSGNPLTAQDAVARAVASTLEVRQLGDLSSVLTPTRNQEAYEEYLSGRGRLRQNRTIENVDAALAHFSKALELDPDFTLAAAWLCQAYWKKYEETSNADEADQAFSACERAEELDADHVETLVALGNLLRGIGDVEGSLEKLEAAREIAPNDEQVYAALGESYSAAGNVELAEQHLKSAIRLDPAHWRNYWSLGRVLVEQGRLDEAASAVRTALELDPDNSTALTTLGGIYFYQNKYLEAAEAFRQSIGKHPSSPAYANVGTQYFFGGDFVQAQAMFRRAAELSPSDFRYRGFLAESILLADNGGLDAAREHFHRAVEMARQSLDINPKDHLTRAALAGYLAELGDDEAAQSELARLEESEPHDMDTAYAIGMAHLALGEESIALDHFQRAIDQGYPSRLLRNDPRTRALVNRLETAMVSSDEPTN